MNTVVHRQNNCQNQFAQPSKSSGNVPDLPRHERWALAQAEIDAIPHHENLAEFKARQQAAWARYGV